MVYDDIGNAAIYYGLDEGIQKGLEFLQSNELSSWPDGEHEIDGENVYAVLRSYQTKPPAECRWEAHKKYIDIQYLISGEERIGCACIAQLRQRIRL